MFTHRERGVFSGEAVSRATCCFLAFLILSLGPIDIVAQDESAGGSIAQENVAYHFSHTEYGWNSILPTMKLPPGIYVYWFYQGRKKDYGELSPQIQIVEDPPACGAKWNEHPFGARGSFKHPGEYSARGVDLFWVMRDCEVTVSMVRNTDRWLWKFAVLKVLDLNTDFRRSINRR